MSKIEIRNLIITACLSVLITLTITLAIVFSNNSPKPSEFSTHSSEINEQPKYVIGTYNEKISVFYYGEIVPFKILDSNASTYTPQDQELLHKGIKAYSDSELQTIIEDYSE